jgi:starch synthase
MELGKKLKVLFVSAEVSPFAKTGGLADVAGSLPQALAALGCDIRVVMPGYGTINAPMDYVADFPVSMASRKETCIIKKTELNNTAEGNSGVVVYFAGNYHYYDRSSIYCHYDDAERFVFFCKAVLQMLPRIDFRPDIIHCNDWHTGPVCMLLKEKFAKEAFYKDISTIFTIHNLEYQGNFSRDTLTLMDMPEDVFTPDKVEFYGMFNFMKAGLVYSDIISTVSETYAREIQTPRYGEKLDGLLGKRSCDLYGIINGISYDTFNPASDSKIYKKFDYDSSNLKRKNKYALQRELGLNVSDVPLFSIVTRLTDQKGLNLILEILNELLQKDIQFVLLGSGDPYFEKSFKAAAKSNSSKMAVYTGFDAVLAQKIYAGSDIFLMPSRFEPCGLGQIISLRYGTIPIVRATGGLADTIIDIDQDEAEGNGFSFTDCSSGELLSTINRAIDCYNEKPDFWKTLVKRALLQDFSWKKPAARYYELYKKALCKKV